MSNVSKLGLFLFIFLLGCTKQDPKISLIGFSSLSPKLSTQGPYIANDTHFTTPYEITGQCTPEITQLEVRMDSSDWKPLTEVFPESAQSCQDKNFTIKFKLELLGFSFGVNESKSFWLRSQSSTGDSQPIELVVQYGDLTPPPTNNAAPVQITSIEYNSNNKITVNWKLPSDHLNQYVILNIQNEEAAPSCSTGVTVNAGLSGSKVLQSETVGLPAFDLNSSNIKVTACGVDNNGSKSAPSSQTYYKTPTGLVAAPGFIKDTQITIEGISSSGGTTYKIAHVPQGDALPDCTVMTEVISPSSHTITSLAPYQVYDIKLCAYNANPIPQTDEVVLQIKTKKSEPNPATGINLSLTSSKVEASGLDPALTYVIDIADSNAGLETVPSMVGNHVTSGASTYVIPESLAVNKKYYVRVWVNDTEAYPEYSPPTDKSIFSYIELSRRDSSSSLWGKFIKNDKSNPHDLLSFVDCDGTRIDGMDHINQCINAGLLWHLKLPDNTLCDSHKVVITNENNKEIPLLWNCEVSPDFSDFQIIGMGPGFKIKDIIKPTGFHSFNIKLINVSLPVSPTATTLNRQTLWSNTVTPITQTGGQQVFSGSNNIVFYIENSVTDPLAFSTLNDVTIVQDSSGGAFSASLGNNITVENSRNIMIEADVKNQGAFNPIHINGSKNVHILNSNIFSSSKGLQIDSSNFINLLNTKFMNIQSPGIYSLNSNNFYISNSRISNSSSGLYFQDTLTDPTKINISQSVFTAISASGNSISFIKDDSTNNFVHTNLNHLSLKDNHYDSVYIKSPKINMVGNQVLSYGNFIGSPHNRNSDGIFSSYNDVNSYFYFSQLGFSNHGNNIILKHHGGAQKPVLTQFYNKYISSSPSQSCSFLDNFNSPYFNCLTSVYSKTFGSFFSTGASDTITADNQWVDNSIYDYWLNGSNLCSHSQTCSLYSATLSSSGSEIIDNSSDLTQASFHNGLYYSAADGRSFKSIDCSTALNVTSTYKQPDLSETSYLANAAEINSDMIGNNNGLCEDNEICILSPNLGAYQGHFGGSTLKKCTHTNNTTGLNTTVYAYPFNGK